MPNYDFRGKDHYGAVVGGQGIVPGRLVYLTKTTGLAHSWRIRDFIGGSILSSEHCELTLAEIENLVEHCDEPAPKLNAKTEPAAWRLYLVQRSQLVYGDEFNEHAPRALQGPWRNENAD